jgi:voltage-gated potassium channel
MAYPILHRLFAVFYRHVAALSWPALGTLVFLHLATSWLAFWAVGEDKAAALDTFWYFYFVTSTTTGYGDVSPVTVRGRLVTVLWLMPGGIALFTAVITKLVQSVAKVWTRRMRGEGDYSEMERHLVIMGWHPDQTPKLVRVLLADPRYDHAGIVLVARKLEQNPMPDQIRFVKVQALPSADGTDRSGARRAAAVVVMGEDDNEMLAIGLGVGALDPAPRIVAHFQHEAVADLMRAHCPTAECSVSLSVEMLARSAQDPGSSEVQRQIISPIDSPSQFRLVVPNGAPAFSYGQIFAFFKARHDATVIAARREGQPIEVNAPSSMSVKGGDCVYFIAAHRLRGEEIDWAACAAAKP